MEINSILRKQAAQRPQSKMNLRGHWVAGRLEEFHREQRGTQKRGGRVRTGAAVKSLSVLWEIDPSTGSKHRMK